MGVISLSSQCMSRRIVAVKRVLVLSPGIPNERRSRDFRRERQAAESLDHPDILL
jgi:hypothetical protein